MTGDRYFAEAVHAYGTTHVFFVPTIMLPAMAEMEDMGIRRVVTHGEKAAAYMADGYARASRRPGMCLAQTIGSANLAAGLRDAYMACSPVIALTGGVTAASRYKHTYQEIEDFPMWEQVTKANFHVDALERFPDLLRQAFRAATSAAPGPVHLELAGTHAQVLEGEAELMPCWEERFMKVPAFRPEPEPDAVRAAAHALTRAERPVLLVGGGVIWSAAEAEVAALAERLQIPVATSLTAKAALPDDHPLNVGVPGTYSRWCANRVVAEADLVFFIGSHAGGQVTTNWQVPKPGIAAIQLDIDPEELGRNYPLQVALLGDAKVTLQKLIAAVIPASPRTAWLGPGAGAGARVPRRIGSDATLRRGAHPPGANLQGDLGLAAGRRRGPVRHRTLRHVDRPDDPADPTGSAVSALRRLARLGVPGHARCQVRAARPAGDRVLRRRRLLLSPGRARDRRALQHQRDHAGQ
jgi:acetolactate synthase-1/2/3 large subunit